jgi:tryptophan synthase alpha chain
VTDGPVIRRSARRALDAGTDLALTLSFVEGLRPRLTRTKIVLLADWRHTVRGLPLDDFTARVRRSGCDGLLLHGVPPRARPGYYASAHRSELPIVTTCFVGSPAATVADAALNATAYLYLVSHFGKGEGAGPLDATVLAPAIAALRAKASAPIAVGFGVRTGADVSTVGRAGADAAIVGSACVASLERSLAAGRDPVVDMRAFLDDLRHPVLTERAESITVGAASHLEG